MDSWIILYQSKLIIIMTSKFNIFLILFTSLFTCNCFAQKSDKNSSKLLKETQSSYHQNVIGISENKLLKGQKTVKTYVEKLNKQDALIRYKTEYKVQVMQALEYEIGLSQTEKEKQLAHIIIWDKTTKKRIFEVIYNKTSDSEIPSELTEAREKWVKLCNDHNSKKLVEALYTGDAIYYNRGRVLKGHEQLTREYGYMNSPSYNLQLSPKHIERVSEDIIYEIGQCIGSYPLPYILVWKKQGDGTWKIFIDSNY